MSLHRHLQTVTNYFVSLICTNVIKFAVRHPDLLNIISKHASSHTNLQHEQERKLHIAFQFLGTLSLPTVFARGTGR